MLAIFTMERNMVGRQNRVGLRFDAPMRVESGEIAGRVEAQAPHSPDSEKEVP